LVDHLVQLGLLAALPKVLVVLLLSTVKLLQDMGKVQQPHPDLLRLEWVQD
jgi:hypothetical protein